MQSQRPSQTAFELQTPLSLSDAQTMIEALDGEQHKIPRHTITVRESEAKADVYHFVLQMWGYRRPYVRLRGVVLPNGTARGRVYAAEMQVVWMVIVGIVMIALGLYALVEGMTGFAVLMAFFFITGGLASGVTLATDMEMLKDFVVESLSDGTPPDAT